MKTRKYNFIITVIVLLFFLLAKPCLAQSTNVSLSLTPPVVEIKVKPGQEVEQRFIISNQGMDTSLKVDLAPFVAEDSYGNVKIGEGLSEFDPQSYSSWFTFQKPKMKYGGSLFLPNGQQREVLLKIVPPEDAVEGDYYFTLTFTSEPEKQIISGNTIAKTAIGANLLITVTNEEFPPKSASISRFSAPAILDSFVPLTYEVEITNTSGTFFKPIGRITITDILGRSTTLSLAPENILASSKRIVPCIQEEQLIHCGLTNKLPLGYYRAVLSFSPNDSKKVYQQEAITLVLPSSVILILLALGAIILKLIHQSRKKKSKTSKAE